ncbi:2-phospho-L-lactate guanylyltransferase [Ruicaihuangia caeni]|uniref:2-phospho-L-lactate guanylyltransferase n=1 Tax=Ruicaihuangia caeni TaxID=3042517 RepID=UPI00338ED6A5
MCTWSVVLPVKGSLGKSRLLLDDPGARARLAVAFALDTIAAASAARQVERIVVVSADARLRGALRGVQVVEDPLTGLNAAIRAGLEALEGRRPAAVLLADLPALAPGELDSALEAASKHPLAMVPDAAGTGTTLTTALRADALVPRFGEGSRRAHHSAGHLELDVSPTSGLRRDVDDLADLEAVALRAGVHTRAVLSSLSGVTAPTAAPSAQGSFEPSEITPEGPLLAS